MKISKKLNLGASQSELDFVDIDLDNDMALFLDPYFLSIRKDTWSKSAHGTLEDYFHFVLELWENGKEKRLIQELFKFNEPKEVCLGLSKSGTQGKGLGKDESSKLFRYLMDSRAVENGVINESSDIPIFVPNIGHDKLSDLTINVIRKHLIEYTKDQMNLYDIPLTNHDSGSYWDTKTHSWKHSDEDMLVIDDKPVILVPKAIVCRVDNYNYFFSKNVFAQKFVFPYLKEDELRINSSLVRKRKTGEKYVTKKDLKTKYEYDKKAFLQKFTIEHPEIYDQFKNQAKDRIKSPNNCELVGKNYDKVFELVTDSLISKFNTIPSGHKHAKDYYELIIATMEFLFYPDLINPVKEKSLHGRQIRYDNASRDGFFCTLSTDKKIPCSHIFLVCKNQTGEDSKPEFDQLNGQLSADADQFGFLVFRKIKKEGDIIKQCQDFYKDKKKLVIPIMDKDFIEMLEKQKSQTNVSQQNFLNEIASKIMLDS